MSTSLFLAQLLAPIYLVMGLSLLFNHKLWEKWIKEFTKSPMSVFVWGFVALVMGLLMVSVHNLWVKDWRVVITIFGWAALLKGIFGVVFPVSAGEFARNFKGSKTYCILAGIVCLGLAAFFSYYSFWI